MLGYWRCWRPRQLPIISGGIVAVVDDDVVLASELMDDLPGAALQRGNGQRLPPNDTWSVRLWSG